MEKPWTEKYRPKSMDEVSHQDEVVSTLKSCLDGGSFPHLLFYGPPGTGKTSTVLAIAKDLFGDRFKERVLELNASDERGISIVRGKIKSFARTAVGGSGPAFKIIILDECDAMTPDAQSAMRRTMEEYSTVTRFAIICNYVTRIIEPLASRCAKFRFKPVGAAPLLARLQYICQEEGVDIEDDALETLVQVSGGDMRKALTSLQSAHRLCIGKVSAQTFFDLSGDVPAEIIENLWTACQSTNFEERERFVETLARDGYAAHATLRQLLERVGGDAEVNSLMKAKIALRMAEVDKNLIDGASDKLQLLNTASYISSVVNNVA
jgi:replication factor C subunit 2/4